MFCLTEIDTRIKILLHGSENQPNSPTLHVDTPVSLTQTLISVGGFCSCQKIYCLKVRVQMFIVLLKYPLEKREESFV